MERREFTGKVGKALLGALPFLLTAGMASCTPAPTLEAVTVLQYAQCEGLEAGVSLTSYEGVARMRGTSLLSRGGSDEADSSSGAPPRNHDEPLLVAVSKGPQPTAGYALTLESAALEGHTAILRFRWETPPQDSLQAQVITHPCVVVALPRGPVRSVQAVDQAERILGSLRVPSAR